MAFQTNAFELPPHPPPLPLSPEQMQRYCRALEFLELKWESPSLIELEFEFLQERSMKETDIERHKSCNG